MKYVSKDYLLDVAYTIPDPSEKYSDITIIDASDIESAPCIESLDFIPLKDFEEKYDLAVHKSYEFADKFPEYKGLLLSGFQIILKEFKELLESIDEK